MSTSDVSQEASRLLEQLKDIHIPGLSGSTAWAGNLIPWAIGITALLLTGFIARRYYLKTRTRRYALHELELMHSRYSQHGEGQKLLNELNLLLRRMAIVNYEREKVASLAGKHWLEFLDRSGRTQDFSNGEGHILIEAYAPATAPFDANALIEVVRRWIKRQV